MDKPTIAKLKAILLQDVSYLCYRKDRRWIEPVVQTLQRIREANIRAVFFGGTLRSLLLSRQRNEGFGRPRDIDIVVADREVEALREIFHKIITRETRFGGFQLRCGDWQFDVWPLHRTWAFVQDNTQSPKFDNLPVTTFFNLEAIAVDVWTSGNLPRKIYSGDDRFFEGIISQTLEINREDNPFPALCVVRSMVFASSTGFKIGPRLRKYLAIKGMSISDEELEDVQHKHYGTIRCGVDKMRRWLDYITDNHQINDQTSISLPDNSSAVGALA